MGSSGSKVKRIKHRDNGTHGGHNDVTATASLGGGNTLQVHHNLPPHNSSNHHNSNSSQHSASVSVKTADGKLIVARSRREDAKHVPSIDIRRDLDVPVAVIGGEQEEQQRLTQLVALPHIACRPREDRYKQEELELYERAGQLPLHMLHVPDTKAPTDTWDVINVLSALIEEKQHELTVKNSMPSEACVPDRLEKMENAAIEPSLPSNSENVDVATRQNEHDPATPPPPQQQQEILEMMSSSHPEKIDIDTSAPPSSLPPSDEVRSNPGAACDRMEASSTPEGLDSSQPPTQTLSEGTVPSLAGHTNIITPTKPHPATVSPRETFDPTAIVVMDPASGVGKDTTISSTTTEAVTSQRKASMAALRRLSQQQTIAIVEPPKKNSSEGSAKKEKKRSKSRDSNKSGDGGESGGKTVEDDRRKHLNKVLKEWKTSFATQNGREPKKADVLASAVADVYNELQELKKKIGTNESQ